MDKVIAGIGQVKTTLLALIVFLLGVIPSVVEVLTNFSAVLAELSKVLSSGDPVTMALGAWSLKAPIVALIASAGLLIARDWKHALDKEAK